jgi:predicted small lipoprotein YifL
MTAGCGHKGALYLPSRDRTVVTRGPANSSGATSSETPQTAGQKISGEPAEAGPASEISGAPGPATEAAGSGPASDKDKNDKSQPPK